MCFNPWSPFGLDPYPLIRPFLFALDPECAHEMTIAMLKLGLGPRLAEEDDPVLRTTVFGLDFPNPIGLAAGLDKQAQVMDAFMNFGFGHVETGTVVRLPQPGNPKPRMFRVKEANGLINRFGWNSIGAEKFAENLKKWRNKTKRTRNPVGVNIGFNKDCADPIADYVASYIAVAPYVDYAVISVSSPNTPGARDLQARGQLTELLRKTMEAKKAHAPNLPTLLKVSPDITEAQQEDIADVVLKSGIQGLIVGNTTLTRPSVIPADLAKETGGFSSPIMFEATTNLLANMYKLTQGKIPLIANCGVDSGEKAYKKIRAGASLVQIYTALVYEGPLVVRKIKRELAALLKRDGFASVAEAVGAGHKA